MHAIPLGAKGIFTLVVAPEHLANRFKDAMLPPLFLPAADISFNDINRDMDAGRYTFAPGARKV